MGFLVVADGSVKVLPAQSSGAMERIVELLPQLVEDLNQMDKQDKKKASFRKKSPLSAQLREVAVRYDEEDLPKS